MDKIYTLPTLPGVQKDGTEFSTRNWSDAQWCRFYKGLPKKMGGYKFISDDDIFQGDTITALFIYPNSPNNNIYFCAAGGIAFFVADQNGNKLGASVDRTPDLFADNINNSWSLNLMYSSVSDSSILLAHAAPNLASITSNVETPIYYGDAQSVDALIPTGHSVSGGIAVLHPFLFMFGNDGNVAWSEANDPTVIMDSAKVTGQKIVAGMQMRGGNSSPAGLLWSLDSVIRVTQVGTTNIEFSFDTITAESSILSSRGIVEYDNLYYWAGVDRFLFYNGVVQELPNNMNLQYFFDNLNYDQRQKVWATKQTKWGEIWWFYPSGTNTHCDKAVIYNVREQTWYNTDIERDSGYFEQTFAFPVWAGLSSDGFEYGIWLHENGVDENVNGALTAIQSYCKTNPIAWCAFGPDGQQSGIDRIVDLYRLEPDFVQTGAMTLLVEGRDYARGPNVISISYPFDDTTQKIDIRQQRRQMVLTFTSNVIGGDYYMGQILIVMRLGDIRP